MKRRKSVEKNAGMAELADAQASGACGSNIVWVQVPSPARFPVLLGLPLGFKNPYRIRLREGFAVCRYVVGL